MLLCTDVHTHVGAGCLDVSVCVLYASLPSAYLPLLRTVRLNVTTILT